MGVAFIGRPSGTFVRGILVVIHAALKRRRVRLPVNVARWRYRAVQVSPRVVVGVKQTQPETDAGSEARVRSLVDCQRFYNLPGVT